MSQLTIRPFVPTDAEYQSIIAIHNAVWPDNLNNIKEFKYRDARRDPQHFWQRLVAEKNGRIVAFGITCETWWASKPGKYYINLSVQPQYQGQGIGTTFYNHVLRILRQQPIFTLLVADTREDKKVAIQFLTHRGFAQVMRFPISELDVAEFDAGKYRRPVHQVNDSGIQLRTVADLAEKDPDWLRKMWALEREIEKDIPSPDPLTNEPFAQFAKMVNNPGFFPEAFVIAVENGRYVGTSSLWKSEASPEKLYTGLTGVLRSHRRRGLATAMKVKNIRLAQSLGIQTIETDNEENNPMYQLNLQLGFAPKPAFIDFHKEIKTLYEN